MDRVFVVGCPRSGTTLLQSMLAAHPETCSFPETHFFSRVCGGVAQGLGFSSMRNRERAVANRFLEKVDRQDLIEHLPRWHPRLRPYKEAFISILDQLARDAGASRWVEKTPMHLHFIQDIETVAPDARFLHILRNGEDVIASLYQVTSKYPEAWGGERDLDRCIDRWVGDVRRSLVLAEQDNHLLVRYEELIDRPADVLQSVCDRLGANFDPAMVARYEGAAPNVVTEDEEWKASVTKPLSKPSRRKFDEYLDEAERQRVRTRLERTELPAENICPLERAEDVLKR